MTVDLWALGLQALNVLILVWLLSRVFWRPVAAAIANRQDAARKIIDSAQDTQARADATLTEVMQARDGLRTERATLLEAARTEAEAAAQAARADAHARAEAILASAQARAEKTTQAARAANAAEASDLALRIAARLLARLDGPTVRAAFVAHLREALARIPAADRTALRDAPGGIEVVTATDPGADRDIIRTAVLTALDGSPDLRFVTDPDLIAGIELRSAHFVLHNSWRADLEQVRKAVTDAA